MTAKKRKRPAAKAPAVETPAQPAKRTARKAAAKTTRTRGARKAAAQTPPAKEKRPPGRPPVLAWGQDVPDPENPGKTKRIPGPMDLYIAALEVGNTVVDAAELAGVGKSTVYAALRRGKADRAAGRKTADREFWDATRAAKAKAKTVLVGRVFQASKSNWRAAIAMLERRHPDEWAKRVNVGHGIDPSSVGKGGRGRMEFTLDFGPGPRPRDAEGNLLEGPDSGGTEG